MSQKFDTMKMTLMLSGVAVACVGAYLYFSSKGDKASTDKPAVAVEQVVDSKASDAVSEELKGTAAVFPDKTKITYADVKVALDDMPDELENKTSLAQARKMMLVKLVNEKVINDAALKAGVDKDAEFLSRLEKMKETLLHKQVLDAEVDKVLTEAELKEKYKEAEVAEAKEQEYELAHIAFKTEAEAAKVLAELKAVSGNVESRFEAAVKAHSIDAGTKGKGGVLQWVKARQLKGSPVETTAVGSLVPQVMKVVDNAFSIILVKKSRPGQLPPYGKFKDELKKALSLAYTTKVLTKLREDSGVKLTGLDNQPLEIPKAPEIPKIGTDPNDMPKMPEPKDFSAVNEKALDDNMVVAVFKTGEKITLKNVRENMDLVPAQLREEPFHRLFMLILMRLVDIKILNDEAKVRNIASSKDFTKKVAEASKNAMQNYYMQKQLEGRIDQTMLRQIYQEVIGLLPKEDMEISLRHILVKTKEEANELIKEIKVGGVDKFNELVKTKSLDSETKDKGGDIGYLPKSKMPADLGNIFSKAPKATLLPEPVKMGEFGYSVMRVEDKRRAEPPSFEKLVPELKKVASQRELGNYMKKLIADSGVKFFDTKGEPLDMDQIISAQTK